jgi:CheY-like chemotaxis protein
MSNKDADAPIILLIEDNFAHAELMIRCLEDNGITRGVYHVSDGESALQYLRRQGDYSDPGKSPRPHVILLDLRLPKIDGLTVMTEIRSSPNLTNLPIVVLTTSKRDEDLRGAYEQHANSYLVKPIDFEKFTQMIEIIGCYWLKWNQTLGE